jgi:hypothetical protein
MTTTSQTSSSSTGSSGSPPPVAGQATGSPPIGPALGTPVFIMRRRVAGESHLVKPTSALIPEPGFVVANNPDGSINAVVWASDGTQHTVLGVKKGDAKAPAPWFSTTAPSAAAKPAAVVTK